MPNFIVTFEEEASVKLVLIEKDLHYINTRIKLQSSRALKYTWSRNSNTLKVS